MAIVQVSRITHRKGLSENLPQLAGAEFGWVVDERRLYIGNGTVAEGAPAIGNTEILTEYSDLLSIADTYTYKGTEAGYTVQTGLTTGDPVARTLQNKLDDFASVRDFGATGDGVTDDTDAINRALFQLFCRDTNSEVRRSLFFPAGTYRVTNSVNIPPYAKLYGEGSDSSIIKLDVSSDSAYGSYVARTADSEQEIGVNIGNNGTTRPSNVEIVGMTFESAESTDVFLAEDIDKLSCTDVKFKGPLTESDLSTDADDIACVRIESTSALICEHLVFDRCTFYGATYGVNTDALIKGASFTNSRFDTLYKGVVLGDGTPQSSIGPRGVRITENLFDNIGQEGIVIGDISTNITGYNIFLDVANNFNGAGNPATYVINIKGNNNVSVGDMFERDATDDVTWARIELNDKYAFGLDKGENIKFGTHVQQVGKTASVTIGSATVATIDVDDGIRGFEIKYKFTTNDGLGFRFGTIMVAPHPGTSGDSSQQLAFMDDFVQNENDPGLTLTMYQPDADSEVQFNYTATQAGTLNYTLTHLG